MKKIMVALALSLFGLSQVAGCGSGSTVSLPQQKTAQLIFSASTSASLPTAVRVIKISAQIPSGVTVPLVANSRQEVDPGALVAFKQGSSVFGRYSAPLLTISVTGDVTPSSLGLGTDNVRDFAGVLLSYQTGSSLTAGSFTSINTSFPDFTAFGFVSNNQVDLTGTLKPAMRVIF
jgi:hypothetical protein